MPNRPAEIIVRCEDLQQHTFIYRCLVKRGVHRRTIQIKHCPKGKGDAKQFILHEYPKEVKALRSAPHVFKVLISMMDADDCTVEHRKRQHDETLDAAGLDRRASEEKIAVLVPRRNIETWIHHLLGEPVTEDQECRRFRGEERTCAPAAEEFARRCPHQMRQDDLPSLRDGCEELQRTSL